jgi:catechol 2,3-dioxygenase-like lactoylglutathione lyase family enzyme
MSATLTMAPTEAVRFHLSLNVSDLGRSVAFYRLLFGCEPAKLRSDYAKFERDDPPLVLSLEPTPRPVGGPLNHLGLRLPDVASLVAMQERLERAGIHAQREEGVECCYARQTKFWLHDPDQTLWEVYTLDGDIDHRGAGQSLEIMRPTAEVIAAAPVVWEHRMGQDGRASFADNSVDEVRLRGSLNVPLTDGERRGLLAEARRVLRPGGRLFVHVLSAEKPLTRPLNLPGPAAVVQHAPLDSAVVGAVEEAGFRDVRLLKLNAKPCFVREGVGLRETQLEGWKSSRAKDETVTVIYKGPFRQVTDDAGNVYPRGQRVVTDAGNAARLRAPEWAASFLILD